MNLAPIAIVRHRKVADQYAGPPVPFVLEQLSIDAPNQLIIGRAVRAQAFDAQRSTLEGDGAPLLRELRHQRAKAMGGRRPLQPASVAAPVASLELPAAGL